MYSVTHSSFALRCSPASDSELDATSDAAGDPGAQVIDMINATSPELAQHVSSGQITRFLAGIKDNLDASSYQTVCNVLAETSKDHATVEEPVQFGLKLGHACAAVACSSRTCELCANSDSRPCESLLKVKYLLGDTLLPACGAPVSVKLVRIGPNGGDASPADIQMITPFILQVCCVPWEYFNMNHGSLPWRTIHDCKTIIMPGGRGAAAPEPVLGCRDSGHVEHDGFVSFPRPLASAHAITPHEATAPSGVPLPRIFFPNTKSRSGEALLKGKRPPFVMVVRAVNAHTGVPLAAVRPAASSRFEVATRRTKSNDKAYVPSMDQDVRVLENIGDKCIEKLQVLWKYIPKAGAGGYALPAAVPGGSVRTVGHMAAVVASVQHDRVAEANIFRTVLRRSDADLKELKQQLSRAVHPDSNHRVFYCGPYDTAPLPGLLEGPVDIGLVFRCVHGTVDLCERGISGMVMRSRNCKAPAEVIVPNHLLGHAPQLKQNLFTHATHAWYFRGHPGWGLYTFQGRRTSRMPPQGAGAYASDPMKPPCYTPPDPITAAAADAVGRRDAAGEEEHAFVVEACGEEDTFMARPGLGYAEEDLELAGQAKHMAPRAGVFTAEGMTRAEASTSSGMVGAGVGVASELPSYSLDEWMPDATVAAGDDHEADVCMRAHVKILLAPTAGGLPSASDYGTASGPGDAAAASAKGRDVLAYTAPLAAYFQAAAAPVAAYGWPYVTSAAQVAAQPCAPQPGAPQPCAPQPCAPQPCAPQEHPRVECLGEFDAATSMGAAPPPPLKPSAEPPPAGQEWPQPRKPAAAAIPSRNWMDTISLASAMRVRPAGGGGGVPGGSAAAAAPRLGAVTKASSELRRMRSPSIELGAASGGYKRPRGEPAEEPAGVMWVSLSHLPEPISKAAAEASGAAWEGQGGGAAGPVPMALSGSVELVANGNAAFISSCFDLSSGSIDLGGGGGVAGSGELGSLTVSGGG